MGKLTLDFQAGEKETGRGVWEMKDGKEKEKEGRQKRGIVFW